MQLIANIRNRQTNPWVQHFFIICLFFICLSCKETAYYDQYQMIENSWDKNKEYYFTYEIKDNSSFYNLSLQIRNNDLYPYQNLWLFCSEEQPIGPIRRDTIECMLADDYGKWYGTGISIFHLSIPIRTHYKFPNTGQYTFCLRQGMRDNHLKGIEQIGLHIEKID